jgi:hypothetical protein
MNQRSTSTLLEKLDAFIRKYYTNRIIRGVLYSTGLILGFFLMVTLLEGVGHFNSTLRTVLFWSFLSFSGVLLVRLVIIPITKLFKLGKIISYAEASLIVGNHFPEVKDKLINTLQLQERQGVTGSDSLLMASIEQRTRELTPVPFTAAIDFGENRRYLKYALPPLVVFVSLLLLAPSLITESTDRLIRYNEEIVPMAPFSIVIQNDALTVAERDDFGLDIQVEGTRLPDRVFVELGGTRFRMNAESKRNFSHVFRNVDQTQRFRLYADGFYFGPYDLTVLPKPVLVNFNLELVYPPYTGMQNNSLQNTGDLTVPEGTEIQWMFNARNTSSLRMVLGDSAVSLKPQSPDVFTAQTRARKSMPYTIAPFNEAVGTVDSMNYRIAVVADRHPTIRVSEKRDSILRQEIYFTGEVQDDYGFKRLTFNYSFTHSDRDDRELNSYQRIALPTPSGTADRFMHFWSVDELDLAAGEQISYFFEIWDNDGVNGSKSSRSMSMTYAAPTADELKEELQQQNEEIKDKLAESLDDARQLKQELDELRLEMLRKEDIGWQEKQKLEQMLEKQKKLQNNLDAIKQENEKKNKQQNKFEQQNESIQKKQEQLQKLMEQVMSDELRELYDEIQRLMEDMNKEQLQQDLDQMQLSTEDLEKELDRALEQFKQLEWEQKMLDTIDELKELAKDQEALSEESKAPDADNEALKEKQEELNERFDKLQEDLEKLEEMNNALENPNAMPDTENSQESIQENMEKSKEDLDKKKNSKASEKQKNAADQMQQMADQMESTMEADAEEQAEEDMEALRALLENIITLSFDQEDLMQDFGKVDRNDPKFVAYGQVQRKLKDDAKMVEDSLYALSKRVMQIEPIVNREIGLVNHHMKLAIDDVGERRTENVRMNQQYVMTSFNNLALLLDEALQQMQQQQMESQSKKPGSGSCNKPGGSGKSKPKAGDMKKMQEALSKQLQQMKEQMGKEGNKGKNNSGGQQMSKELAEMAAKQAAIRKMMEELSQELNKDGSGAGNEIKEITKEMEKLEEDIVNKRIDQETLERQQDILIRLLKAENAERTREEDERRQSQTGNQGLRSTPPGMEEYLKEKERETELLRTIPPSLKPYYRDRVNEYFNTLER